jgi:hypothetical protein
MFFECDDDDVDNYNNSSYEHGELGKVEDKHIKVLRNTLRNFYNMDYDVNPAKQIMFDFLKNEDVLKDDSDIKKFGFDFLSETLFFKLRDEKLRDNTYLFNTETGEVYFISETLLKHINSQKYNDYNKIISGGIKSAYSVISDIKLCMSFRSM